MKVQVTDAPIVLSSIASSPVIPDGARMATVDPTWNGTGNPRVMFDSETVLTQKTYPYTSAKPKAGDKVLMEKVGNSWLIVGSLTSGPLPKRNYMYSVGATAIATTTLTSPSSIGQITIPDPGWKYKLKCWACAHAACATTAIWAMAVRIDSTSGANMTHLAPHLGGASKMLFAQPSVAANSVLEGSRNLFHIFYLYSGSGTLGPVQGPTFSGMFAIQEPA